MEMPARRIIIIIPDGANGTDLAKLLISHGAKLTLIATGPERTENAPEPDRQLVATATAPEQHPEPE